MSLLQKITDKLVLQPTTHYIDPEERERVEITTASGSKIEAWCLKHFAESESKDTFEDVVLLKFPGTGGRAERSGPFPANLWESSNSYIWTINHRGWGGSDGPATLQNFTETCDAAWEAVNSRFPRSKIVLYGNSLGGISALYLAARVPAHGLYLRNTPPLLELISRRPRYSVPSLGMSRLVANTVPKELDAVQNARQVKCPTLFVSSSADRVVPSKFQNLIMESVNAPKSIFVIEGADHHHRVPVEQEDEYIAACRWLEKATREFNV